MAIQFPHSSIAGISLLLTFVTLTGASLQAARPSESNDAAHAGYVDAKVCATCHSQIFKTYQVTGMANSFSSARLENTIGNAPTKDSQYYHAASESHFSVMQRSGKYYLRRDQVGYQGKETNVEDKSIDFVIGSGRHARTFLHWTNRNTLQELPLGWYAENGGHWGMNPGYDRADQPGSRRTISYECIFCHNAYPQIPSRHDGFGAEAAFLTPIPTGIDCQRCHGPGSEHVKRARAPGATQQEIRSSILNPSRLATDREMEMCMQCHLQTTSTALPHSILRYDRAPFSYRPGEPLGNYILFFDRASPSADRFEIAQSAYRLRQSECFLKSNGALRCTTCHDPHGAITGQAEMAHYNGICRQCHQVESDAAVTAATHTASSNCVACHMPKRRTDDVVHVIMTDHRIQRRKPEGNLLATIPISHEDDIGYHGEVVAYYPRPLPSTPENLLYLAVAQVRTWTNLRDGLPQLKRLLKLYHSERGEFYLELADGLRVAGEAEAALPFYEESARRQPDSLTIRRMWATALMSLQRWTEAAEVCRSALQFAPDDPAGWYLLGQIYLGQQKVSDAVKAFHQALILDPESAEANNGLGIGLVTLGDRVGAEKAFREAIRLQPGFVQPYSALGNLLSWKDDLPQASYYFETATRLDPSYAAAHLNYALMLNQFRQFDKAEIRAQAALAADPNLAEAHELLGALLERRNEIEPARQQFEAAVRIRPAYARAQLSLGAILARTGNGEAALEHLHLAAESSDPSIRKLAQQILEGISRR